MKLNFVSHQPHQIDAIDSIRAVFEGQTMESGDFEVELMPTLGQMRIGSDLLVGNNLVLEESQIMKNVQGVQERNGLPKSEGMTDAMPPGERGEEIKNKLGGLGSDGMNFSIEMETGTGKTYVYLRSIYELYQHYGFRKFVIVVPSIAIKEGVMKNLEITSEHFGLLYNHPQVDFYLYDPRKRGQLKNFGTTNTLQILVINIDSFTKEKNNIIYQSSDWGVPVEYIRAVKPIIIVDEPQNMETDIRKQAIANLNPLCTLRFSATHKNPYNLLYKLDPVKAYDLGLVKKIEVDSVFSEDAFNDAYLRVINIKSGKKENVVTVEIDKSDDYGFQKKSLTISVGDDLCILSGGREVYRGYILEGVNNGEKTITFTNGKTFQVGQKNEQLADEIMKYQIRKTIENHFDKEKRLKEKGIKVLSLFFIDRVANYRTYLDAGSGKGKFAEWFEEIYAEFQNKPKYAGLFSYSATEVHDGYFAKDKTTGHWKNSREGEEGGSSESDGQTYELIMKNKEKLLDSATPLRFIFSHSALREGWDNPNVFQICTLNETQIEMKKRQEIGRGLRLPVDHNGDRVFDQTINILTVIANESYESFAKSLQIEMMVDCGVNFSGRIKDKNKKKTLKLKKGYELDPNFRDLWDKIRQKTKYSVSYETVDLIILSSKALEEIRINKPKITNIRVRLEMGKTGIETQVVASSGKVIDNIEILSTIPDVLTGIQGKTKLTKSTILEILKKGGKLGEVLVNPEQLVDEASRIINECIKKMMIDGIKYEIIAGSYYEMRQFANDELESYLDKLVAVENQEKTLYDHIIVDSETIERPFARDLDSREDVKFYFKLPYWFKIQTPVGEYNPDWAIVFEGDKRVYFVAETKGTDNLEELSPSEKMKILCGRKHFAEFENVGFVAPVTKLEKIQL